MPIKGITDRERGLPRIGKIHLGVKDEKKGYPKATKYFVFPADHPQFQDLVDTFGEEPTVLRVVFPINEEERIASQFYRCYSRTRGLICKGDGETCRRLVDTQTGALADADSKNVEWKEMLCAGRECADYGVKCKEVMNLQFMLPEIPGLGIWQIDTGSYNSIMNINAGFDMIRAIYGRIAMVPLLLSLEPREVTPEGAKKKTVRVLHIRSADNLQDAARRAMMEPMKLIASIGVPLLPTPDDEIPDSSPVWEGHGEEPTEQMSPEAIQDAKDHLWQTETKPKTTGISTDPPPPTETPPSATESTPAASKRDPATILTWHELVKACHEDFKLQPPAVKAELNVSSWDELSDTPADCYRRIASVRE